MIGKIALDLILLESRNLKEKRRVMKSLKDTVYQNFKVSIAEVDYEELWQRSSVLIAIASKDIRSTEKMMQRIYNFFISRPDLEVVKFERKVL